MVPGTIQIRVNTSHAHNVTDNDTVNINCSANGEDMRDYVQKLVGFDSMGGSIELVAACFVAVRPIRVKPPHHGLAGPHWLTQTPGLSLAKP